MKRVSFKASAPTVKKLVAYILDHDVDEVMIDEVPEANPLTEMAKKYGIPIRKTKRGHPYRLSLHSKGIRSIFEVAHASEDGIFSPKTARDYAVKVYGLSPKSMSPALSIARINGLIEHNGNNYILTQKGHEAREQMASRSSPL